MHFKNLTLIAFLLLTLLGSQSMSNCNPSPPPEPGLTTINLSVQQEDGSGTQYALVGLFGASDFSDTYYGPPGSGCLIDTFYTDILGERNISYLSDKYNYFWLAVLPDNRMTSDTPINSKGNHQLSITTKPAQYLIHVNVKKQNFDSVGVRINNILDKDYQCEENGLDLSNIPLNLDFYMAKAINAGSLMKGIPNETNNIQVDYYKNGEITQDTLILVEVADTIVNVQIN